MSSFKEIFYHFEVGFCVNIIKIILFDVERILNNGFEGIRDDVGQECLVYPNSVMNINLL